MTPVMLLAHLRIHGAEVTPAGNGNLRLRSPEPLPADLIQRIRLLKPELLRLLVENDAGSADQRMAHPDGGSAGDTPAAGVAEVARSAGPAETEVRPGFRG